jgi:hypothetical protein
MGDSQFTYSLLSYAVKTAGFPRCLAAANIENHSAVGVPQIVSIDRDVLACQQHTGERNIL